jgi:hypothetical protein
MRLRLWPLLALAALLTSSALGADYVTASGKLSDEDFYRLVACGAAPGMRCRQGFARWSRSDSRKLTVSVTVTDPDFPPDSKKRIIGALDSAIGELNGAGAAIKLVRTSSARANIRVYLVAAPLNSYVQGTGNRDLDGGYIEAALTSITWQTETGRMRSAAIAFSRDMLDIDVRSVVLEELTQSLGLIFDIRDPYYDTRSIFSEDSNSVVRISGQDAVALRMHYPTK